MTSVLNWGGGGFQVNAKRFCKDVRNKNRKNLNADESGISVVILGWLNCFLYKNKVQKLLCLSELRAEAFVCGLCMYVPVHAERETELGHSQKSFLWDTGRITEYRCSSMHYHQNVGMNNVKQH